MTFRPQKTFDNDGFLDPNQLNILPVQSKGKRDSLSEAAVPVVRSGKIIEEHYAPKKDGKKSSKNIDYQQFTSSVESQQPSSLFGGSATAGYVDTKKSIQQRLMSRLGTGSTPAGGPIDDGEHKNYKVHYTSFYGLDVEKDITAMQVYNGEDKQEEVQPGAAVDPRFAYLYKGFKPQKGTKFKGRKGVVIPPNAKKKDELERPAFIGAPPPEKTSDTPKIRHERFLKMSGQSVELDSQSDSDAYFKEIDEAVEDAVVWDQRSRAPEALVLSSLDSSYKNILKETNLTSEQRIQNLITCIKSTLSKLLVSSVEFQRYVEKYLTKMIKDKGWRSLTTSAALFLTVSAAQKVEPLDPPSAFYKCVLCQLAYPPEKYPCMACGQRFVCLPELYVHDFEAHGRMNDSHTVCSTCNSVFLKNPVGLRTHFKVNHCCEFNHLECPFGCKTLILETHSRALPEHVYSIHACIECDDLLSSSLEKHIAMFHADSNESLYPMSSDASRYDRELLGSDGFSKLEYGSAHKKRSLPLPVPPMSSADSTRSEGKHSSPTRSQRKRSRSKSHERYSSHSGRREESKSSKKADENDLYEKAKQFIDKMLDSGQNAGGIDFSSAMSELGLDSEKRSKSHRSVYEDRSTDKYTEERQSRSNNHSGTSSRSHEGFAVDLDVYDTDRVKDKSREMNLDEEIESLFGKKRAGSSKLREHSSRSYRSRSPKSSKRRSRSPSPGGLCALAKHYHNDEPDASEIELEKLLAKEDERRSRDRKEESKLFKSGDSKRKAENDLGKTSKSSRHRSSRSRSRKRNKSKSRSPRRKSRSKSKDRYRRKSKSRSRSKGHSRRSRSKNKDRHSRRSRSRSKSGHTRRFRSSERDSRERKSSKSDHSKSSGSKSQKKSKSRDRGRSSSKSRKEVSHAVKDSSSPKTKEIQKSKNSAVEKSPTSYTASKWDDDETVFKIEIVTKEEKSRFTKCTKCPLSCPPNGGYFCGECSERFLHFTLLYMHMQSEHGRKLPSGKWDWDCEFCGEECRSVNKLHEHLSNHYCKDEHIQCPLSCTTLLTNNVYDKHLLEKHNSFFCDVCEKIVDGDRRDHDSVLHKTAVEEMMENTEEVSDSEMEDNLPDDPNLMVIKLNPYSDSNNKSTLLVNRSRSVFGPCSEPNVSREVVRNCRESDSTLDNSGLVYCYGCSLIYHPSLSSCASCQLSFIDPGALADHAIRVHHCSQDIINIDCQFCEEMFSTYEGLLRHRCAVHFCPQHIECTKGCNNLIIGGEAELSKHIELFHSKRTLIMGNVTSDVSVSKVAERPKNDVVKCDNCPIAIPASFELSCEDCREVFFVHDEWKQHSLNAHKKSGKGFYRCMICVDQPEFTDDINSLIEHRFVTHEICKSHVRCPDKDCRALLTSSSLEKHAKDECVHRKVVSEELVVEKASHVFETPEMRVCNECSFATLTTKLYECEKCAGIFPVKEEFYAHLQYDHDLSIPEMDFWCEECSAHKEPVSGGRWRQHRLEKHKICRTHFTCPNYACHLVFSSLTKVKQHLKEEKVCFDKPKSCGDRSEGWKYCNLCNVVKVKTYQRFCPLCPGKNLVFVDDLEFGLHLSFRHKKKVHRVKNHLFCETCGVTNVDVLKLGEHRFKTHNTCHKHFFCRRNTNCQFVFSLKDRPQIHDKQTCVPPSKPAPTAPKVMAKEAERKVSRTSTSAKDKKKEPYSKHTSQTKDSPSKDRLRPINKEKPKHSSPSAKSDVEKIYVKKHCNVADSQEKPSSISLDSFKLFRCDTCSRKFGTHSVLQCEKCDSSENPYVRQFINIDEYNSHASSMHNEVKFGECKCSFCSHTASDPKLLQKHLHSEHGYCARHWVCLQDGCAKLFGDQIFLQSHIEEEHSCGN